MRASPDGSLPTRAGAAKDSTTDAVGRAHEQIRRRIASGELTSGTPLREKALAEELDVSRTPVREALRLLAGEGLVDMLPRRGAVVTTWTDQDLDEIFELRALLEGYACELAAKHIEQAVLIELDEIARQMETLGHSGSSEELDELTRLYSRFHHLVLHSSGHKRLELVLAQVIDTPLLSRTFHRYSEQDLNRSTSHHKEIVAALRAGAAGWARSAMQTTLLAGRAVHAHPGSLDGRLGSGPEDAP